MAFVCTNRETALINNSRVWYKQVDKSCFYPSGVFVDTGFMGMMLLF